MTPVAAAALRRLLVLLEDSGYRFVTPTPATHARVLARVPGRIATTLGEALGWSLPFVPGTLDAAVEACLREADMLAEEDGLVRAGVRVSSLHGMRFLHSAYPTDDEDAVFFGPDSYRFADLVAAELAAAPCARGRRLIDIGSGAGVGAAVAVRACPGARVVLTDVNAKALDLARINLAAAGIEAETREGEGLAGDDGPFDVAILNPPYIIDEGGPTYRRGGGMHGGQLSLDLTREAAERLAPGGRIILYTGSAIVAGRDELAAALAALADKRGLTLAYREIDPDVFGEELEKPGYRDVDRIALVAANLTRDE